MTVHWDRLYLQSCFPWAGRELAKPGNLLFLHILAVFLCAFHVVAAHAPHLTPTPPRAAEQRQQSSGCSRHREPSRGFSGNSAGCQGMALGILPARGSGSAPCAAGNHRSASQPAPILCLASCCITSPSLQDHDSALLQ